ncbi:MAG TPA: hypothetical protein VGN09_05580 [Vicinamibacteria bacterium]
MTPATPNGSPLGFHSYDPGLTPSEVLWTAPVTVGSVKFDFDHEKASLQAKNILVFDVGTVPNSFDPNHPLGRVHAIIDSLRIDWSNTTRSTSFNNCDPNAFRGDYLEDSATIQVTATTPPVPARTCPLTPAKNGFRFVSEMTTASHFAQIGRERNGAFY